MHAIHHFLLFAAISSVWVTTVHARPLSLLPENPHYFLFRGEPTVLITSGEHYGAVLNLDFDYVRYFKELKSKRLNLTRTFTGAYVEPLGAFNIASNTLAPASGRFICPWARSDLPGYAHGGNKFDLTRWDENYFRRLKDFMKQADRHGVVVEMNLFCPFYEESQWKLSPQNAANNINGLGQVARTNVYTLDRHGGLLAVHEAMVRKIVTELNGFDNLYYEICNEPYFGGVTMAWQHRIADVIVETERNLPKKHLISQNIANGSAKIENPHPAISIFNFHYAAPPDAVAVNYHLNKVIGDNETGFRGTNDLAYRVEGWNFILAGGGLYNNLDYSFVAGHEDGTFVYPASQPGGGNPVFRNQLKALRQFIEGVPFWKMQPDASVVTGGVPDGATARALAQAGKAYAIYVSPAPEVKDQFSVRWTGRIEPAISDSFTFHTLSNDGVRLWIDNQLVVDNWTDHSAREDQGAITLQAGRKYALKLEYYQAGGGATMKLFWSSPKQKKEIIPSQRFSLPDEDSPGLKGSYYAGKNFDRLLKTRVDPRIDFDWSSRSPLPTPPPGTAQTIALSVQLPAGSYEAAWLNPLTGNFDKKEAFKHDGGNRTLHSPPYQEDIALRIRAR
ncbi:MAG: PA14 domain-containing protein [Verrucomicrobiota bacterium]